MSDLGVLELERVDEQVDGLPKAQRDKLTEALRDLAVPAEMFENPGDLIQADTKITLDLDPGSPTFGRIYGIVAPRGTCLLSDPSARDAASCWTIDDLERDDPDLAYVHQGDALVRDPDGSLRMIKVAVLSGDLEHSTGWMTADEARAYIENTGTQIAAVRYHWHEQGLVLSGVLFPSAMETETIAKVLASPVSIEARVFTFSSYIADDGRYRLTGAILVNQPGLPLRRASSADVRSRDLIINGSGVVFASNDPSVDDEDDDTQQPVDTVEQPVEQESDVDRVTAALNEVRSQIDDLRNELRAMSQVVLSLIDQ